jgi:putative cardiolipin synthase
LVPAFRHTLVVAALAALLAGCAGVPPRPEAFAIRARTAQLAAADRGVSVRLLVDDLDARSKGYGYAALDAHPRIEVRLFNPFRSRRGTLAFAFEFVRNFDRANRRMHNKSWIADNRLAVVGGRNLGNEYFGASRDVNFVDLDFAVAGPVVRDVSASFDRYWNAPVAYPIATLVAAREVTPAALDGLRARLRPLATAEWTERFVEELGRNDAVQRLVAGDWSLEWSPRYRFVADHPLKVLGQGDGPGGSAVLEVLGPAVQGARQRLRVISPYFVPGEAGTRAFVDLAGAGTEVWILTNSLAANDVAAVYGGYAGWRKPLLGGGVRLWELKPQAGAAVKTSLFGSSGASLHTKALAVDGTGAFVGSFNLDPRSASLNTEQGVLVESAAIAGQVESIFALESSGARAWSVTLEEGGLRWTDGEQVHDPTPEASLGRKFQAWLAAILPVSDQL